MAALPTLIKSSDAVISRAPARLCQPAAHPAHHRHQHQQKCAEKRQAQRRRLQKQPELACEHEVDRHDDQRRDEHHPAGPAGPPSLEARAERGQQQRAGERERAFALRRPEQVAEQDMSAHGRAHDDQKDRQAEDQLLPVLLDEFGSEARPGPLRQDVDFAPVWRRSPSSVCKSELAARSEASFWFLRSAAHRDHAVFLGCKRTS